MSFLQHPSIENGPEMGSTMKRNKSKTWKCLTNKFFILTTRELSVNKKDLGAPTLAGPPLLYQGSGPPCCTPPRQPTIYDQAVVFVEQTDYKTIVLRP